MTNASLALALRAGSKANTWRGIQRAAERARQGWKAKRHMSFHDQKRAEKAEADQAYADRCVAMESWRHGIGRGGETTMYSGSERRAESKARDFQLAGDDTYLIEVATKFWCTVGPLGTRVEAGNKWYRFGAQEIQDWNTQAIEQRERTA